MNIEIQILIFFAVLGVVIGSFLNVVILRYNTGRGIMGRSSCSSCDKNLSWYELVPVLSFLLQRGRCVGCRSKISKQYALVEASTAILFALAAWMELYSTSLVFTLVCFSLLVVIFVYDFRHKIIPDVFSYSFAAVALLRLFVEGYTLTGLLAGPLLALPFYLIWKVSSGKWMGLGDAKLALGIGWFLGLSSGLSAIAMGFWIGALFGIFLIKKLSWKGEIPFGPFLIAGLLIAYIFNFDFFQVNALLAFL